MRYDKILNMLGIIVALEKEVENLINLSENTTAEIILGKKFYKCVFSNKEVIIAISNVGKVASAMTCQLLIDKFNPSKILNFGSVGGIKERVSPLKLYAVDKCCQYDFDLSAIDDCPIAYNQNYNDVYINLDVIDSNLERVTLATSDKFTHQKEQIEIINSLGASIYDMEGCAIAQVCKSNSIPLYMIKGVTDVYGSGLQGEQFINNLNQVGKLLSEKVIKLINIL